jgi:hypothetical protein
VRELAVTLTFYDEEIDLLQASADEMTAWSAAQVRPNTWTIKMIVRAYALVKARDEAKQRAEKSEVIPCE